MSGAESEALRRWRLVLGEGPEPLAEPEDERRDDLLAALYPVETKKQKRVTSARKLAGELADLPLLFPDSIQEVLQQDALERLGLRPLLRDPSAFEAIELTPRLAADLLRVRALIPAGLREQARALVERIATDLERRIAEPLGQAVRTALSHSARTSRPRADEMDWPATIRANLRHYQARYRTVIPATRLGRRRRGGIRHEFVICVDQSGSMAESLVHTVIAAGVLGRMRGLRTRLLAFDTRVVDLSEDLHDAAELLLNLRLDGGTDIGNALAHAREVIREPERSAVFLLSDLIEGGSRERLLRETAEILATGANVICLLSLSESGAPVHDAETALELRELGVPVLACALADFPGTVARVMADRR